MTINRYELVHRHHPKLTSMDVSSPFTVGNGEFAFTADITGLQSLYNEYKDTLPLCTMSQWGWHTTPVKISDENSDRDEYSLDDLVMTEYDYNGRKVSYPKKKIEGNEHVYNWLRENPHRLNLSKVALLYKDEAVHSTMLDNISQELNLYDGVLLSEYNLDKIPCKVESLCDSQSDTLGISVESEGFNMGLLSIEITFPYGASDITASNWNANELHTTEVIQVAENQYQIRRILDKDVYYVNLYSKSNISCKVGNHSIQIHSQENKIDFSLSYANDISENFPSFHEIKENCNTYWNHYWNTIGVVDLHKSKDTRALELERRIVLSQYLLAVNSCGSTPPQETGLTCNSWYGKMHLEMYLWHCAWAPLWNQSNLLERSLPWYLNHREEAKENARRNGYKGCRWPKMIASEGIDCPSPIAPLLVWQQPHIIFMLELCYRENQSNDFLETYYDLISETAEFMVDFVVYNEGSKRYDIIGPVIPVQECHQPMDTKNPTFEVEYFRYTLDLACEWANRLGKQANSLWRKVADNMAELPIHDNKYIAHEFCYDTFTRYNIDHPSMLGAYGLIPNPTVREDVMRETLDKVIECWDYPSLWGWDFAVMAMTATRLGEAEKAIDILLVDSPKNDYVLSGNNRQILRNDLPLYLPGNGALLLAIPIMVAGYEGCNRKTPGFPDNGMWEVNYENISPYL